jgi:hypothetical protein
VAVEPVISPFALEAVINVKFLPVAEPEIETPKAAAASPEQFRDVREGGLRGVGGLPFQEQGPDLLGADLAGNGPW